MTEERKKLHNQCEGCNAFHSYTSSTPAYCIQCSYHQYNFFGRCPCTICMLKIMCQDECAPFRNWTLMNDYDKPTEKSNDSDI